MIQLIDSQLGTLDLRCDPFVVVSFQIGSRAVRAVARPRALADGVIDDTKFVGARAATVTVRLNDGAACRPGTSQQELFDLLLPYMSPRRRPLLRWSLPGSDGVTRQMVVRGDSAPMVIAGPRYPVVALAFVSDGEITDGDSDDGSGGSSGEQCETIEPTEDVESGRVYDLAFPRDYPVSNAIGWRQVTQSGNEAAHWTGTISGPVTNPFLQVNDALVTWTANGGLVLNAGDFLTIDTRERTMFFNGDPTEPRYDRTNFPAWWWDDLLLQPGVNAVRYGDTGQFNICWRSTWAG